MDELELNKDKIFWTWSKILILSQRKYVFRKKIFFKIFKISTSNSKHFPPSKYFSPLALHQSQSQCQVRLISPYAVRTLSLETLRCWKRQQYQTTLELADP